MTKQPAKRGKIREAPQRSLASPEEAGPPITIYTDGACLGNPGPGGYAAIVETPAEVTQLCAGYRLTTNNRMEMMAAIAGLESLTETSRLRLYSDSQYLINGMKLGWARRWQRNAWRRNAREPALNPDLWQRLLDMNDRHEIEWVWVRGHVGNPMNELCDRLAVDQAKNHAVFVDEVYEAQSTPESESLSMPRISVGTRGMLGGRSLERGSKQ